MQAWTLTGRRPSFSPVARTSGVTIYTSGQTYPTLGDTAAKPAHDATLADPDLLIEIEAIAVL